MRLRLLTATAALTAVAGTTLAAAAGTGPVDLDAVRDYGTLHGLLGQGPVALAQDAYAKPGFGRTPQTTCAPGSRPETGRQGRVPLAEYVSGRAAKGYTCNATDIAREGDGGGFQVHRYVDKSGRECAYYDQTTLFPRRELTGASGGVAVLDMKDPAKPVRTAVLDTFAMRTPHESLRLNAKRGLLVAVSGSPVTQVGIVDVYDVSGDCRTPVLRSTSPLGILGHEGGFSPDGLTYYAATTADRGLTAIDLTDPSVPKILWRGLDTATHGLSVSDDGTRLYLADVASDRGLTQNYVTQITNGGGGMRILDVTQIQQRALLPQVKEVGYVTWPEVTIPQNTIPVTIKGRKYVIEFDEYDSNVTAYSPDENVGGVRIIDISDETRPKVVSRIRLAVWEPPARAEQADDPGAASGTQGYAAHYCSVPKRAEPGILACSMIASGLRVFDVSDPLRPREVAYANHPAVDEADPAASGGGYAMSAPAFDPATRDVWYSDANSGFRVERLNRTAWPRP
ncbi:MAG: hypothetical protein JWM62_2518 [Frankiales bacterium]|jgi:hypothetical protein|nr:hypothetical protein [Frankiales bacterium]